MRCPDLKFSPHTTQRIATECLLAIQDVHVAGFVHRDIKPGKHKLVKFRDIYLKDYYLG